MNRQELLNDLSFLDSNEIPSTEIYILNQPTIENNEVICDIYKARLHERIPAEIKETFFPKIKKSLVTNEYELTEYNPALLPDYDVIWQYNSDIVPFYNVIKDRLSNVENYYNSTILPYEEIWALWIKFSIQRKTFYLLKKITPSKIITTGGSLAVIFSDDTFKKLESDVLSIDGTFDVFSYNDFLFFEHKLNFERALLYQTVKQEVAEETLNEIGQIGFLDNFEAVKEFLKNDYHSINKLNKIKSKPYFNTLTFSHCKRIIDEYGLRLAYDEASGKFNIETKKDAKKFIKVLNDDFLKSEMTNIKYAANSKEDI